MRPRVLATSLAVVVSLVLTACFSDRSPTAPGGVTDLASTLISSSCSQSGRVVGVDLQVRYLIDNLFAGDRRAATHTLWENIKSARAANAPLQEHIDALAMTTLGDLLDGSLPDPDGSGALTATTGATRMLDLVFSCAGVTPTAAAIP